MSKKLINKADVTYNFNALSNTTTTNVVETTLLDAYSMTATKTSHNQNWRPGENITYILRIVNSGTEPIFALSIQDDLGGAVPLLTFMAGSAVENKNGVLTTLTPTVETPLTFVLASPLLAGEIVTISYIAKVNENINADIAEIVNSATIVGHEVSESGPVVTVTPNPTHTLIKADYASLRIVKTADKEQIASGDELVYMFKIENSGNINATGVKIVDILPEGFTIQNITALTNGVLTTFAPADYSIDASNKLVLPTSTTKTISVPAATTTGVGVTVVSITGTVNS